MDVRAPIHAAKTDLSRLVQKACRGEEIVVARGDSPVVRLTPMRASGKGRRFGDTKGRARAGTAFLEPPSQIDLRIWEK